MTFLKLMLKIYGFVFGMCALVILACLFSGWYLGTFTDY